MKTNVANTDYYSLDVDNDLNRLYLTATGLWASKAAVADYLTDIERALGKLQPGFTILADVGQAATPPQEVGEVIMESQKMFMAAGVSKTAEIHTKDVIMQMAAGRFGRTTGIPRELFETHEEAEEWLNQE